jgi:glycosyl transferase, family 25
MKEPLSVKVINLGHRDDRRLECTKEFGAVGLTANDYAFFGAKHLPDFGVRGCALSHAKAISDFLFEDDRPHLLILEDDFSIRDKPSFIASLDELLQYRNNWDVFLLAHNLAIPVAETPIPAVKRVISSQTASGYIVGRLYAAKLVECFFRSSELLSQAADLPSPGKEYVTSLYCCDMLWRDLQIHDRFWARFPSLTQQRPSYSDIEKQFVDYKV